MKKAQDRTLFNPSKVLYKHYIVGNEKETWIYSRNYERIWCYTHVRNLYINRKVIKVNSQPSSISVTISLRSILPKFSWSPYLAGFDHFFERFQIFSTAVFKRKPQKNRSISCFLANKCCDVFCIDVRKRLKKKRKVEISITNVAAAEPYPNR